MIRKLCDVHQLPIAGELRAFADQSPHAPMDLCVGLLGGVPYAIENRCPHQDAPLSAGKFIGDQIACPLHGWKWRITDGQAASSIDPNVRSFELRRYGDEIFVRIPEVGCGNAEHQPWPKKLLPCKTKV
jgi:hypothetical protein